MNCDLWAQGPILSCRVNARARLHFLDSKLHLHASKVGVNRVHRTPMKTTKTDYERVTWKLPASSFHT